MSDTFNSDDYLVPMRQAGREAGLNSNVGTFIDADVGVQSRGGDYAKVGGSVQVKDNGEPQFANHLSLSFGGGAECRGNGEIGLNGPLLKTQNDVPFGVDSEKMGDNQLGRVGDMRVNAVQQELGTGGCLEGVEGVNCEVS